MAQKHYIIYETKNLKNGKIYIGMHETDDLNDGYLGSGYHIRRSIRHYGKEFFERKILFDFDNREEMIKKEIELVTEEFVKRKDTYNLKPGGRGGIYTHGACVKGGINGAKVRALKIWNNVEFRKRHVIKMKRLHKEGVCKRPDWTGKKHSEETKDKMRVSQVGKQNGEKNSQFGTMWIHNPVTKENKKIKKNDIIPDYWIKGRK